MKNEKKHNSGGFVLIELLLGLAVMGILSGITLCVGKTLIDRAYIERDRATLIRLVLACNRLRDAGYVDSSSSMRELVLRLATVEDINDVRYYRSSKRRGGNLQPIVDDNGNAIVRDLLPDWIFILHCPSNAYPGDRVPVLYSYGLREDGTWSEDSPYGTQGGFIAFASGRVVFVRNAKDVLISYQTNEPVEDITEARPEGAKFGRFVQFNE